MAYKTKIPKIKKPLTHNWNDVVESIARVKSKREWQSDTSKLPYGLSCSWKSEKRVFKVNPINDVMLYDIVKYKNNKNKFSIFRLMGSKDGWYETSNIVSGATKKEAELVLKLKKREW